jgi:hypothetical protein
VYLRKGDALYVGLHGRGNVLHIVSTLLETSRVNNFLAENYENIVCNGVINCIIAVKLRNIRKYSYKLDVNDNKINTLKPTGNYMSQVR